MELDQTDLLGIDNIRLDLPVAGVGSRVLAATLDYLLLGIITAILALGVFSAAAGFAGDAGTPWATAIMTFALFLLDYGYFAGWELVLDGRTPAKIAVGLQVVARDGSTPDAFSILTRNLVRSVDLLIGIPLMALDPLSRRLGDRFGSTLVVHTRRARDEVILERVPEVWSGREVAVVESFFARRPTLNPDQARFLARRLVAWVERDAPELLAGTDPDSEPEAALEHALGLHVEGPES